MAGDWIPMRVDLLDDPAVIAIAAAVGLDEYAVAGRLLKLWSWANRHLKTGHACVPDKWVDDYLGTAGFAAAMLSAGWLRTRSAGGLEFTSFDRWNSQGAKIRLGETLRKRAFRQRRAAPGSVPKPPGGVPKVSRTEPPQCPGPEKRREEIEEPPNPPEGGGEKKRSRRPPDPGGEVVPVPPGLETDEFREAWAGWLKARRDRGARYAVTEAAARAQLAKLERLGSSQAVECIAYSIANQYQGLIFDRFKALPGAGPPPKPTPIKRPTDFQLNGAPAEPMAFGPRKES